MTDALAQINDRLADAARAARSETVTFLCECGDCLPRRTEAVQGAPAPRLGLDAHVRRVTQR
jgi:hypothetical protein